MRFYPRKWAKYEEAIHSSIKLVPPYFRIETLRSDYKGMGEMLFDVYPSFNDLMDSIMVLEKEINRL